MASFRKDILQQIERIDAGRIFTFQDLSFDTDKMANVAVLLSGQIRKGLLVRIEKGAYYRPRKFPRKYSIPFIVSPNNCKIHRGNAVECPCL